jgi:hypothetical protein
MYRKEQPSFPFSTTQLMRIPVLVSREGYALAQDLPQSILYCGMAPGGSLGQGYMSVPFAQDIELSMRFAPSGRA